METQTVTRFGVVFSLVGDPPRCACLPDSRLILFARRDLAVLFATRVSAGGFEAAAIALTTAQLRDLLERNGVDPDDDPSLHWVTVEAETEGLEDARRHTNEMAGDFVGAQLTRLERLIEETERGDAA